MQIWQTYRNEDETEGRGPIVPDKAFLHQKHAAEYIDSQPGVMCRRGKWSETKFGDWSMKPVNVLEHSVREMEEKEEELKYRALCKLTPEELELLGLEGKKKLMDQHFDRLSRDNY